MSGQSFQPGLPLGFHSHRSRYYYLRGSVVNPGLKMLELLLYGLMRHKHIHHPMAHRSDRPSHHHKLPIREGYRQRACCVWRLRYEKTDSSEEQQGRRTMTSVRATDKWVIHVEIFENMQRGTGNVTAAKTTYWHTYVQLIGLRSSNRGMVNVKEEGP